MQNKKFAGLSAVLSALVFVGLSFGQVICPDGKCPPIVGQTGTDEVIAVEAFSPHVRCIMNGSCGSGTICGADKNGAFVLTNAHVAGTTLGRSVAIDLVTNNPKTRVFGRTVFAGYSDRRMVDFCVVYVEGLRSRQYMPLKKLEPAESEYQTTGSPRCVWPQVLKDFNDPRNYGDGLITGSPNAIGGQSGSAIYNSLGQQVALLTWTINGRCAGQKTSKLWQVATERNVELADPRPQGLTEVYEGPRAETQEGIFGGCDLFETTAGQRAETENVIASVVGSAFEEMPIWVIPDSPTDPTDPGTGPGDDCPPGSMVLTDQERDLIGFIRAQNKTGIRDGERAIDWATLIRLIFEIIQLIQQGRATP